MLCRFGVAILVCFSSVLLADDQATATRISHGINLVFVGDSITEAGRMHDRAKQSPSAVCAAELTRSLAAHPSVYISNDGHSGATTLDFLPPHSLIDRGDSGVEPHTDLLIRAHPDALLMFSFMLGTNDSANKGTHGAPVAADDYGKNLRAITDELIRKYPDCLIVIHQPIFYTLNTHNGADYEGASAHDRLLSYSDAIESLIKADGKTKKPHLFLGDTSAYGAFESGYHETMFPEKGKNGVFYLHPNEIGSAKLGKYWAVAIEKVLQHQQ